jgi:hypothetical protein
MQVLDSRRKVRQPHLETFMGKAYPDRHWMVLCISNRSSSRQSGYKWCWSVSKVNMGCLYNWIANPWCTCPRGIGRASGSGVWANVPLMPPWSHARQSARIFRGGLFWFQERRWDICGLSWDTVFVLLLAPLAVGGCMQLQGIRCVVVVQTCSSITGVITGANNRIADRWCRCPVGIGERGRSFLRRCSTKSNFQPIRLSKNSQLGWAPTYHRGSLM